MSTQARYQVTTLETAKIDPEAGTIRGVSIMTAGEAQGHGLRVDMGTLQKLNALATNGGVKAFLNHSMMPAPTEAIGIFSGFYMEPEADGQPAKLRATFTALKAFREYSKKEYATLMELAEVAPASFGVSVSIWQDVEDAEDGGSPYIRPTAFDSADFVSTPAANKSLFASKTGIDISDTTAQTVVSDNQIQPSLKPEYTRPTMKMIQAKFSANTSALARAVKYMAEDETITEEAVVAKVDAELSAEEVDGIKQANAQLTADNSALTAKVGELEAKLAELQPAADKLPAAEAAATAAKDELSKVKAELSASVAKLARYGVAPVKTVVVSADPAPVAPVAKVATAAEFSAWSPSEKMEFSRKGGRIEG